MLQSEQLETLIKKINNLEKKIDEQKVLNKKFLDLKEACCYLNISDSLLYKLVHRKEIRYQKPNRKLYFLREELDNWVLSNNQNNKTLESVEIARQEVKRFVNQL